MNGVASASRPPGSGRRELTYAVLACAAGAGLVLFAATRTWMVQRTVRAAPLPALTESSTGADLAPWLSPLALVGLAGAGALLATRGAARSVVGVLIAGCGAGVLAGGGYGLVRGASVFWPVVAGLGGLAVAAVGVAAVPRGRRWPAMGARYEARPGRPVAGSGPGGGTSSDGTAGPGGPTARSDGTAGPDGTAGTGLSQRSGPAADTVATWAALDRGEDPTAE